MPKSESQPESNHIKEQRDRFLAFAFASADLFLEISLDGKITYTNGAAKGITGIDPKDLKEKNWLDLFAPEEHAKLIKIKDNAKEGLRCGPHIFRLDKSLKKTTGVLTGIRLPDFESFYITLSISNTLAEEAIEARQQERPEDIAPQPKEEAFDDSVYNQGEFKEEEFDDSVYNKGELKEEEFDDSIYNQGEYEEEEFDDSIYNQGEFIEEAETNFEFAEENKIETAITTFELGKNNAIPKDAWPSMLGKIANLLNKESINKKAAAQLSDHLFTIIHNNKKDIEGLRLEIENITKEADPEQNGVEVKIKTIDSNLNIIKPHEASRALHHTLNDIATSGTDTVVETLDKATQKLVIENKSKIKEFTQILDRLDFDLRFQPVVDLRTREAHHYETLCRFKTGNTHDWIMFCEDIGMAPQFDRALTEMAMNFVHYKAGVTRTRFSINISGKSIEDPKFFKSLQEILHKRDLVNRVMFEITGVNQVRDLTRLRSFVQDLQSEGYEIALDDFAFGPRSFEFLQKLSVDYVKTETKCLRHILQSDQAEAIMRDIVKLCKDLNTKVIAKPIETEEQVELLKKLGIGLGQGYLFGKPENRPSYVPKN